MQSTSPSAIPISPLPTPTTCAFHAHRRCYTLLLLLLAVVLSSLPLTDATAHSNFSGGSGRTRYTSATPIRYSPATITAHKMRHRRYEVSREHPIHILFPLPTESGRQEVNPFGITIDKARPVVDEAIEEVYRRQLIETGSIEASFEDSKLSDAHGPNVAINQLVDNRLDCIIGYAFVYALAPVARMSPYWRDKDSNGIPVITSIGLTANLDNRKEYQLMTRISSPYKVVKNAVIALFKAMNWTRSAYFFHEQRADNENPSIPYGECYLLMSSLQPHLYQLNRMDHNYFMFNELKRNRIRMLEHLRRASMLSNGRPPLSITLSNISYEYVGSGRLGGLRWIFANACAS